MKKIVSLVFVLILYGNLFIKRKAKELISKKFMEEQFKAAKKKVDAREEKENG